MSGNIDNNQQQTAVSQITTTSTGSTQMAVSSQVQVQQQPTTMQQQVTQHQLQHLQQASNNGQHQQAQGQNQMQQLQVVQQQLQNQTYLPQIYNTQGQQIIMPGNILHHGLNPQIQVISAGKSFQPNQLGNPHMLSTGNIGYTAIPTSGSPNNQTYILGSFINSPQQSQLQHGGKHGDISKVISPQIGTQLPPGLTWASPHTFLAAQNSIFIRGTQPDQMFIQQPQQIQTNAAGQQHFSMPLTASTGQSPTTSIGSVTSSTIQQGQQQQSLQGHQNQQHNTQTHVSIKSPATLQPKPPLQIQPQPQQQQQQQQHQLQQQQQQLQQLQQVTMAHASSHQIQMIPQQSPNSQTTQSISISQPQMLQQTQQQSIRQLTILPQQPQNLNHSIQGQQMQFIQQGTSAPQAIRPNYTSSSVSIVTTQAPQTQQLNSPVTTTPQQRPKIRKPGVGRGTSNGPQQSKPAFPRASAASPMAPMVMQQQQQRQIQPQGMSHQHQQLAQTMGRVPVGTTITQHQPNAQPLKTINLLALQGSTNSAEAAAVMIQQSNLHQVNLNQQNSQIQHFPGTSTQLPVPNVQTTGLVLHKKDPTSEQPSAQAKGDTEKENSKRADHDEVQVKQKLPKAMVKPQVLTHVIEGFVIQEAAEPFPMPKNMDLDEPPEKKVAVSGSDLATCEMCGKVEHKAKFKRKRFCSSVCAKNMKTVQQQKQQNQNAQQFASSDGNHPPDKNQKGIKGRKWGESFEGDTDETSSSMGDHSTLSPNDGDDEPKVNPKKWDVTEVVDFVKSLPGCAEYANDFADQEIDGQALMLLKEDHLMSAMNMKLGPALKLCAKIEAIRAGFCNNSVDAPK